jgi:hypothetical protein
MNKINIPISNNHLFTLQVNISAGDIAYAMVTVRQLALNHLAIPNRLLVVDCCRPQRTKLVNPEIRFPEPLFSKKVDQICAIAEQLMEEQLFTDVYYLRPGDEFFKLLSKKYLNGIIHKTHGAGATAQMSYWAAIELVKTRYIIHYDGDLFFYQENGYEWWHDAVAMMDTEPLALFAIPRHAPPSDETGELPTFAEGTEIVTKNGYWLHNWFSTRMFLLDKGRLQHELPVVNGKVKWQLLLRKLPFRAFPLDPEIILFRRLGMEKGYRRIILQSEKAWLLHPLEKSKKFFNLLPLINESIQQNKVPKMQKGREDILMEAWESFLDA